MSQQFLDQNVITLLNMSLGLMCSIVGSIELFFGVSSQMVLEHDLSKEYHIVSTSCKPNPPTGSWTAGRSWNKRMGRTSNSSRNPLPWGNESRTSCVGDEWRSICCTKCPSRRQWWKLHHGYLINVLRKKATFSFRVRTLKVKVRFFFRRLIQI